MAKLGQGWKVGWLEGAGKVGRSEGWRGWGGRLEGWRGDTAGKARGLELKGPGMVGGAGQIRKVGRLEGLGWQVGRLEG